MKKILIAGILFFVTILSINAVSYQEIILKKVNIARREKGLKPLKINEELNKIAIVKAKDMAKDEKLSHNSKKFGMTFNLIKKEGIRYSAAAENIARWHDTPEFVAKRWLNSKGHRKNILNPDYDETGIGLAKDKNGKNYWVQLFIKKKK
ncbi:uncharacterized protein, YkwD family [Fusobacterium necrogenes]|uniref:Uncharacterized protein, YkwD family n=1 Tax=Fusobacterium necrogenes TaxID=858 RepID=A0A377GXM3_9FUSO|nr:CAP domain-containing protein [Fusobacterium necrogenes]STO31709.1 uncharacterized protein, YkwD family [Fusobacterium necrogenes]